MTTSILVAAVFGLLLGFVGSIPVAGPVSAIVVSRGIQGRFESGVYLSVGAGIAEALYAALAFWGFGALLTRYSFVVPLSRGAAAVILAVLGVMLARATSKDVEERHDGRDSRFGSFALGFSISALNPTLLATWTAAVATLYSTGLVGFSGAAAVPFAAGTAAGIAAWFVLLLVLVRRYRAKLAMDVLARAIRVIGWLLLFLSAWFAWRFVEYFL